MNNTEEMKPRFPGVSVTIPLESLTDLVRDLAAAKVGFEEMSSRYWALYGENKKLLEEAEVLRNSVATQAASLEELAKRNAELTKRWENMP